MILIGCLNVLLEKEMAIHSSTFDGKSHGRRSMVGYSLWGHKELDTTEQLHLMFYTGDDS